jgi:hypothetical protein
VLYILTPGIRPDGVGPLAQVLNMPCSQLVGQN